jgi:hypothetical protein
MITRGALVAMLVVSCEPGHQLLTICALTFCNFSNELKRIGASQCGRKKPVLQHFHITILSFAIRKPQVAIERWACVGRVCHAVKFIEKVGLYAVRNIPPFS